MDSKTMKRGGEGLQKAREVIAENRRKRNNAGTMGDWEAIGYVRACDDCLKLIDVVLAAAPAMKRDQLDTQRQAENDGDRIRALVDKVQGWRNEANAEGTRLNLLGDPEHGYFSEVEAYDKVLSELRATAATPTEPPKMSREAYEAWADAAPNGKRDLDGLRREPAEFCRFCGAGLGKFRRSGEGTCPKCA